MTRKPLKILIADDEEDIRALVRHWLEEAGHAVTTAADAIEAVQQLQQQTFDLVITDVLMPEGDGLELIASVKRAHPLIPIVAMSGGGRYLEGDDCLKIARGWGVHQTLMKPFDRAQLRSAMDAALAAAAVLPRPGNPAE